MEALVVKILRILIGLFLTLLGALGIFIGFSAIIDPVGAKMSDDVDPFGVPPSLFESLTITIIFTLVFAFGILLTFGLNPLSKLQKKLQ